MTGVDKITYKVDGGAEQTYDGPFTVDGEGEHVVEYFASDKAENVESVKKVAFRVDATAPETTASAEVDEADGHGDGHDRHATTARRAPGRC